MLGQPPGESQSFGTRVGAPAAQQMKRENPGARTCLKPAPVRRRAIPLAAVGGTLDAPRVEVSPQAVRAFASLYGLSGRGGPLEGLIEQGLGGAGSGAGVVDALEGILGGPSKR